MTRSSDQLHSPLKSRMIRLSSHKCREKRMMNIYDLIGIMHYKIRRNDLHISCQYDKIYIILFQQFQLFCFLFDLIVLIDRKYMIIYIKSFSYTFQIRMVTDNDRNLHIPLSGCISRQYIIQTMRHLRYKYGHTRLAITKIEIKTHIIFLSV